MNKVILLGRLTRDPEVRYTQAAEPMAVCRFSVAVDRPYSSNRKEGDRTADFINCVCFGRRGESIGQYFHKGNRIAVTGRLQVSEWQDNSGNRRFSTDVVVEDFDFCESKGSSQGSGYSAGQGSYSSNQGGFSPNPGNGNNNGSSSKDDFFTIDSSDDGGPIPF